MKSDVRLSGLGASYPAAFVNCLPHFSRRTQSRVSVHHQNESEESQKWTGKQAMKREGNMN